MFKKQKRIKHLQAENKCLNDDIIHCLRAIQNSNTEDHEIYFNLMNYYYRQKKYINKAIDKIIKL